MNIAISGASGFIGRHLTAFLTEQGHRVVFGAAYVPGGYIRVSGAGIVSL